jgi:hypothetical protein
MASGGVSGAFFHPQAPDRPRMTTELGELIQRMAAEKATWRAPRIHGEMFKLSLEVSECSVSRYLWFFSGEPIDFNCSDTVPIFMRM